MAARFVVVGAGAIGCHIGGRLQLAGAEVIFVARARTGQALAAQGLAVADLGGAITSLPAERLTVVATPAEAARLMAKPDLVLLCTKTGATTEAAAAIGAAFAAGTVVLSLQNGVDAVARIAAAAPDVVPLAGMVPFNVTLDAGADGRLIARKTTSGALHAGDHAATRAAAGAFAAADLALVLEADMAPLQWGKLLLNLNNPVNALADLPLREELLDRDYRRVLAALQDEALAVMRRAGIHPGKAGAAPPWAIPLILRLPTFAFARIAASMLTIDPAARSSMWDDVQAGRPTEIDDLCGAIVRLAAILGGQAPRNAAMIALIRRHRRGQRMDGPTLLRAITAA